ncbi:MAG: hypothetical protein WDW36_005132 [Sanguina aurantia]
MGCETVTLYVDLMSQPSRACVIFCRLHGLPVVESIVNIGRGETKAAAFRAINPLGKVPALQEKGPDGTSQLYLALRFAHMIPSHWYPPPPAQSDSPATRTAAAVQALRGRTDVTSALHWYHSSIRAGCARIVWNKVLAPRFGVPASEAIAQEGVSLLQQSLKSMDDFWLRVRGPSSPSAATAQPFLCGADPCVADLLCACEMEQLAMLDLESHGCSMASLLQPHPAVQAWLRAVAGACGPQYAEVHSMLAKSVAAAGRGKKATASRL